METSSKQYDSYLEGNIQLPNDINIPNFVSSRLEEISALDEAIKKPLVTKRAFQLLPRHMRRRVMSHSTKRVPRRIREIHRTQLEQSGLPTKKKRPSRKHRRHATNLLLEYERRRRSNVWLESHIWHAKRFHMGCKWGYKLPLYPNDKGFRACHRAMAKHCLLQDISYYVCIEFHGPEIEIINGLKDMVNPKTGLTFAAASYIKGNRHGEITLYKKDKYPFGAIGLVNFFWRPKQGENQPRTLWIWLHPSCFQEALDEFIKVFQLTEENVTNKDTPLSLGKSKELLRKNIDALKLINQNVPFERTPKYIQGNIRMTILKDTLNRFRLTGPLSHQIICKAFNIADISPERKKRDVYKKNQIDVSLEEKDWRLNLIEEHEGDWVDEYYATPNKQTEAAIQKDFWEKNLIEVPKASDIPLLSVLGFTIDDPRVSRPNTSSPTIYEYKADAPMILSLPDLELSESPIWESRLRDIASCSKPSDDLLGRLRSNQLVPGLDFSTLPPYPLPILMLQRNGVDEPGNRSYCLGFGSGWDIIIPAGWASPVWLSLVFRGARVGGIRESESLAFESGSSLWYPDTQATQKENEELEKESKLKYFRKPPDKRVNYRKLRVTSPFACQWTQLLKDWLGEEEIFEFYVLRDKKKLETLNAMLDQWYKKKNKITEKLSRDNFSSAELRCLVPVSIKMTCKGRPSDLAIIALPGNNDFKKRKRNQRPGLVEQSDQDQNERERKEIRTLHQQLLRTLRRRRKKGQTADSKDIVEDHAEKMRKLWLPDETISASRRTIGWVTKGDQSLSIGQGRGIGFVALPALFALASTQNSPNVWIRNTTSLQYKIAQLQVRLL